MTQDGRGVVAGCLAGGGADLPVSGRLWAVVRGSDGSDDEEADREQTEGIEASQPKLVPDHIITLGLQVLVGPIQHITVAQG